MAATFSDGKVEYFELAGEELVREEPKSCADDGVLSSVAALANATDDKNKEPITPTLKLAAKFTFTPTAL